MNIHTNKGHVRTGKWLLRWLQDDSYVQYCTTRDTPLMNARNDAWRERSMGNEIASPVRKTLSTYRCNFAGIHFTSLLGTVGLRPLGLLAIDYVFGYKYKPCMQRPSQVPTRLIETKSIWPFHLTSSEDPPRLPWQPADIFPYRGPWGAYCYSFRSAP
jgi:hypothetical protein